MPEGIFNEEQPSSDATLENKIKENATKDPIELAKGKAHADQFIEFLKGQNAALKEELDKALEEANKRISAEKVLKELETRRANTSVAENTEEPTGSSLDSETIKSLVKEGLKEEAQKATFTSNMQTVTSAIEATYGDKSKEFIANKAKELSLSVDELGALAAKSPNAFFNLVGFKKSETQTPAPSKSTINTAAMPSTQTKAGTKAYYDELRKTDKKKFFSPAVQAQLFKDRERLGLDYYK